MMILLLSLVINLKPFFVLISFLFFWFMSIIIIIFYFVWLVGYYTWTALPLLVISMFFMHVVILLKICYAISDKQKYISLVVVVPSSLYCLTNIALSYIGCLRLKQTCPHILKVPEKTSKLDIPKYHEFNILIDIL